MKCNSFSHTPLIREIDGDWATLKAGIQVVIDTDEGKLIITAAKGFTWNGKSFPIPKRFYNNNEDICYLVHDILYHNVGLSRADADDILRGMLREVGRSRFYASTTCWGCNTFARKAFGGNDKRTLDNLDLITVQLGENELFPGATFPD